MSGFEPMGEYFYVVRSEFAPSGPEDEWNRWYSDDDIQQMLAFAEVRTATRFRELDDPHRYQATYDIDPALFDKPEYKNMTGWQGWGAHVVASRRLLYKLVEDLGPVIDQGPLE